MHKLITALVVATTSITACGSSTKSTGSSSTNGSTTTAGNTGASDFSDLVNKAKDADYKVTYDTSGKTVTVAQDGNGKRAVTTDGGISISDGKTTITCTGTTSTATCRDFGAAGTATFDALMGFVNSVYSVLQRVPTSASSGHTSSDTIAGREATCITIKASDVAGAIIGKATGDPSVTSCVDAKDGYLLKYSTTQNGTTNDQIIATAAGPSSPSDFDPPATAQTLPSLPTGSG